MPQLEDLDTDEPLPKRLERHFFDRLIMLSDGVFAIAITLAALEIRPPDTWTDLAGLWGGLKFPVFAFAISFAVIAAYWGSHRDLFARLKRVDQPMTAITLVGLFLIALIPAATQLLYRHGPDSGSIVAYASVLCSCGLVFTAAWAYASLRPGLMTPEAPVGYRIARCVSALLPPALFGWIAFVGVDRFGSHSLLFAGAAAPVLFIVRRVLVARWLGRTTARTHAIATS